MNLRYIKVLAIVVFASIGTYIFSGCSGETGPQGPAGNTGANGNANISTYLIAVADTSWKVNSNFSWELDYYGTSGLSTSGAMECFFSDNDTNWTQLPWVSNGNSPFYEQAWTFNASGAFLISWYNITAGSAVAVSPPPISYFNMVSIPPSIMIKHPGTNWNNAAEVRQLPEIQAALSKSK